MLEIIVVILINLFFALWILSGRIKFIRMRRKYLRALGRLSALSDRYEIGSLMTNYTQWDAKMRGAGGEYAVFSYPILTKDILDIVNDADSRLKKKTDP